LPERSAGALLPRRGVLAALGAAAANAVLPARATAQTSSAQAPSARAWPTRPIRLIVPFPPGGATDLISRLVVERIAASSGWSIVVENRSGARGNVGLAAVSKAAPDGYIIGIGQAANLAINPTLYARMPFDPLTELAPIASVASQGLIVVVAASSPFGTLADLVEAAEASPQSVTLAHPGNGTVGHLGAVMLARRAGIELAIVPYRAASLATQLAGGQVDVLIGDALALMPLHNSGVCRALAVTSFGRLEALPDVPTVAEAGYPGFAATNWSGLVAPAGTADEIIAEINAHTVAVLRWPGLMETLARDGSVPFPSSPAEFAAFMRTEHAKWGAAVTDAGVRIE
jgi:tripartite-type tricarboxylate transporter receptor subunit TctC